jgi:Peptidase family C25
MNLIVTLNSMLQSKYGSTGLQQIDQALRSYSGATGGNSVLIYVDDSASMALFGLPAIPGTSAGAVLLGIRNLCKSIGNVQSVLLIGGDDIVPYWQMRNPVTDREADVDEIVYSDNPYGASRDEWMSYLSPELPVGRLADSSSSNSTEFSAWIRRMQDNHTSRLKRQGSVAIFNSQWADLSTNVSTIMPPPVRNHAAPGYAVSAANSSDLDGQYLYFNLHGFDDSPQWRAFDPVSGRFVTAVDPTAFANSSISGSVVYAENCYAGLTVDKTATSSCALRLMQQGAAALIAPTGLAFGSYLDATIFLENADYLAASFFRQITSGPVPSGRSLSLARQDYIANEPTPYTNPYKQKTLLQFNLLGDPSL